MLIRSRPVLVGVLVSLVAAGVLLTATRPLAPALARGRAIRIAVAYFDHGAHRASFSSTSVHAAPVDSDAMRVTFYDGSRVAAEVAVNRDGNAAYSTVYAAQRVPYGDWLAYQPGLTILFACLFVFACGVLPLWRLRNLDVLAALALIAPVVLLQQRYLSASVLSAVPSLAYLMVRCAWRAVNGASRTAASVPIHRAMLRRWEPAHRLRLLRLLVLATAILLVMVGVSSPNAIDVAFAVMEGATKLLHGSLPYGHMPGDIFHGDTYPILSYVLYAPLALISPVHSIFNSVNLALAAAAAAALAAAWGTARSVQAGRSAEDRERGLIAALALLAFPTLLVTVSTGTTDVVLAAMLVGAVLVYRRPAAAGAVLAVAGWFKLAPFALLPVWVAGLRGRRRLEALAAVALVSAAAMELVLAVGGSSGPAAMLHAIAFQFSRGSPRSLWAALHLSDVQPVAEGCVIGLIAALTLAFHECPELGGDRARLAAAGAALLIALQLTSDNWAFLYVAWFAPLVVMSLLTEPGRPRRPKPPAATAPGRRVEAATS